MLLFLLASCSSATQRWHDSLTNADNISDKSLKLAIAKLPFKQDTSTLNYMIRITPADDLQAALNQEAKTSLLYKMDSCIYLTVKGQNTYPALCQNISSGIKGTYEYMVTFDITPELKTEGIQLTYKAKVFNKKEYSLKLN